MNNCRNELERELIAYRYRDLDLLSQQYQQDVDEITDRLITTLRGEGVDVNVLASVIRSLK